MFKSLQVPWIGILCLNLSSVLKHNTYLNYQVEGDDIEQVHCFPWHQLERRSLPGSWVTLTSHTLGVCTQIWKDSLLKLHFELLPPCCCSVLFYCSSHPLCFWSVLSGFFKTTRNKLSLLAVFVAFGVEMSTWIAEPWSTGGTLPPPAQRWAVLGPSHAFMAENRRCWAPSSSLWALCVFLPLLLGYNYLETWLP